jgi:hypothetical protein
LQELLKVDGAAARRDGAAHKLSVPGVGPRLLEWNVLQLGPSAHLPSLSMSAIIFLISSFLGSKPRALHGRGGAGSGGVGGQGEPAPGASTPTSSPPSAPWHRWCRSHLCRTGQRPRGSPASAPLSALAACPCLPCAWRWQLPGSSTIREQGRVQPSNPGCMESRMVLAAYHDAGCCVAETAASNPQIWAVLCLRGLSEVLCTGSGAGRNLEAFDSDLPRGQAAGVQTVCVLAGSVYGHIWRLVVCVCPGREQSSHRSKQLSPLELFTPGSPPAPVRAGYRSARDLCRARTAIT